MKGLAPDAGNGIRNRPFPLYMDDLTVDEAAKKTI